MLTNLHMNIKAPEIITMKPGTDPYTVFSDVYAFSMYFSQLACMCVNCVLLFLFSPRKIVTRHRYVGVAHTAVALQGPTRNSGSNCSLLLM